MAETTEIEFTGNASYNLLDEDLDGLAEALAVDVEVRLNTAAAAALIGQLSKNGQWIANRPAWESMLRVRTTLDEIRGTHSVRLQFSGEQIYRSKEDGPYDLLVSAIGPHGAISATLATPAFDRTLFGEVDAHISGVAETTVDADAELDYLEMTLDLDVRLDGEFLLQGTLDQDGQTLVEAATVVSLKAGARQVPLRFDGRHLWNSGVGGTYDGAINLIDAEGHTLDGISFTTEP